MTSPCATWISFPPVRGCGLWTTIRGPKGFTVLMKGRLPSTTASHHRPPRPPTFHFTTFHCPRLPSSPRPCPHLAWHHLAWHRPALSVEPVEAAPPGPPPPAGPHSGSGRCPPC